MSTRTTPSPDPATIDDTSPAQPLVARAAPDAETLPSPGALRSETYLILQTRQAQRLVQGRRAVLRTPGIVGLTRFATLLRPIWNGVRADDPYADWWLVRVHDAIDESERELGALKQHIDTLLRQMPGISVSVAQSVEPVRIPLAFTNPYAFRGSYLLSQYDALVRAILTARHVALLDRDRSERLLADAGRHVRRAFTAALGYRFLGINRDDLRLMTARAKQAEDQMGALPKDVLEGTLRAAHAPEPACPASERGRRFGMRGAAVRPTADADPDAGSELTAQAAAPGDGARDAETAQRAL
jgi:integrating conjugative element protein (TIGR03761 family)